MTELFRDREPPLKATAPPLGVFVTRATLRIIRTLLHHGHWAEADAILRQLERRQPRMPTKAEEASL